MGQCTGALALHPGPGFCTEEAHEIIFRRQWNKQRLHEAQPDVPLCIDEIESCDRVLPTARER
jgi:hypothetical protein